jgi:hypothetical protein
VFFSSISPIPPSTSIGQASLQSMTPHPFAGRTPEALVGRNDSKNPSATCRGITNSGRPCRRAIASHKSRKSGVVAIVEDDGGGVEEASYYCHDHKAQAVNAGQSAGLQAPGRKKTELFPLKERTSVDTLVQRLGVEGVGSEISTKVKQKRHDGRHRPERRQDAPYAEKYGLGQGEGRQDKKEKSSFWSALCCMGSSIDDDYVEIVRHKKRLEDFRPPNASPRPSTAATARPSSSSKHHPRPSELPLRPAGHQAASNSQTVNLLSLIPQTLSPATTSALLTELGKPPNPNDEEGYIYMFWLTPQQSKTPDTTTARSLLSPDNLPRRERRISDVVSEFSYTAEQPRSTNSRAKTTILLKIGRANNVTRRMNEWQRQCGYALTLVRWYPYVSSSAAPSPAPSSPARSPRRSNAQYTDLSSPSSASRPNTAHRESSNMVRKVPYVKRVERLIHLELAEKRVMRDCAACGREHREWFEVEASEKGVRNVDEVVRRWVAWGENQVA